VEVLAYDSAVVPEPVNDPGGRPKLIRDAVLVPEQLRLRQNFSLSLRLDDFTADE
jgi:hypothetical protein